MYLAGAAEAVIRAWQHQHIDVVWTGPETATRTGRLTAAVIIDLIGQARREILIVSYATMNEFAIVAALTAAVARGVEVTILAERHEDNPGYDAMGTPFPGLRAVRLRWPASRRPAGGSALHAKIIVIDDRVALVGSANSQAVPWKPILNAAFSSEAETSRMISGRTLENFRPKGFSGDLCSDPLGPICRTRSAQQSTETVA